jgi:hypothetical protein
MRGCYQKYLNHRPIVFVIFTCVILFTLGCNLFSVNYWVHRMDDNESDQLPEPLPAVTNINAGPGTDSSFGSKCLNSPGTAPCPIDACVVDKGQYTAKYVVTSELFGKANPSDYQCCADFQFTNNSGVDLMGFEHLVTEYTDNWFYVLYPVANPGKSDCSNYFSRKDGKETLSKGVTEIVVLFANPHCDWIQWDEPGLAKYREPVEAGCYQN